MTESITLFVYTGPQNENAYSINKVTTIDLGTPESNRMIDYQIRVREALDLLFGNPEVASVTVSPEGNLLEREVIDNPANAGKQIIHQDQWDEYARTQRTVSS